MSNSSESFFNRRQLARSAMLGGASMLIAALLTQWVKETSENPEALAQIVDEEGMLGTATPVEPAPEAP